MFAAFTATAWTAHIDDWVGYLWLTLSAVWILASFSAKNTQKAQPPRERVAQALFTVAGFYLLFHRSYAWAFLRMRVLPDTASVQITGFILLLAGIGLAIFARFEIGRNWSSNVTVKEEHQLISRGPYAMVRHPIYSGLLLGMLGTAIVFGYLHGFIGVVLAATGLKLKSLVEERFMTEQFGAEYVTYCRRVKGLVPFVW